MSEIAHTMPVLIRNEEDIVMMNDCLESLKDSMESYIFYNQGGLSNQELSSFIKPYIKDFKVLGNGTNDGIPFARQACFKYIWEYLPSILYITEIHPDMIFPPEWTNELVEFLEKNPEEPCICPGILTKDGQWHPHGKGIVSVEVPSNTAELIDLLEKEREKMIVEGFVHPVMHRASHLKLVGGYITEDLPGIQGYEDDYLLLSYFHMLRLPAEWRPKSFLSTYVFHRTMAQRADFSNMEEESNKNLQGLLQRFGTQGITDLQHIHSVSNPQRIWGVLYYFGRSQKTEVPFIKGVKSHNFHSHWSGSEEYKNINQMQEEVSFNRNVKTISIIDHPYWVNSLSKIDRHLTIAWLKDFHEWNHIGEFYLKGICSVADIILTASEEVYWQLALSHPFVLLCAPSSQEEQLSKEDWGLYSESDYYLKEIIESSTKDQNQKETWLDMINKQREERIQELEDQIAWDPHNEANFSLLAKYHYLNGQYGKAEHYFFQAFSRNVVLNKTDGMNKYYSGICLAQVRQGKTKEALNSYGILAQPDDLKQHYLQLLSLYNRGQYEWVQAEICRIHGDLQYARKLLDQIPSPEADNSKYLICRNMMDYARSEEILSKGGNDTEFCKEFWLVKGEKEELFGNRPQAIHYYLQAAVYDENAINNILRMEEVDRFTLGEE
ncbi:tetratricopeptide repeat protein [Sediminibacillus massiliensis]|uniref:tetratricopeptide repeat protein n=1 Tax=Sediminibacillus massiliensis TaxID=1926277 RepID=UPI0009888D9E|nr:hypothetical protein [Sediminibacillus massiliensis]